MRLLNWIRFEPSIGMIGGRSTGSASAISRSMLDL